MKRYTFLVLAAITMAASYFLYTSAGLLSADSTIDELVATVELPEKPFPEDHFTWIDSVRSLHASKEATSTYQIVRGDTFSKILTRLGLEKQQVNQLTKLVSARLQMSAFQVGKELIIYNSGKKQKPHKLEYKLSISSSLMIDVNQLKVAIIEKEVATKIATLQSTITTSLAHTMQSNGVPTDLADKLLSIFAWDIDFAKLLKTDSFNMVYEAQMIDDQVIGSGKVLAAVFIHKGKKHQAYYFEEGDQKGYFDEKGNNMSRAPLQYDMITSLYQKRRFHPVKRRYRAHLGMDFMADEGTPVNALKDGVIIAAGFQRANGNYVKIKHEHIITQYLHLSSIDKKVAVGRSIKRGQQIGTVGSTGLSSGPHLCLRVWDKGKQKDPLDYPFDRNSPISAANREAFERVKATQDRLLEMSPAEAIFQNSVVVS